MPRRPSKSLQTILIETIIFVGMFALVGHLSVNFWERYVIQSELIKMKSSLYSLKETINIISVAYDNLHKELRGLTEYGEKDTMSPVPHEIETELTQSKNEPTLDWKSLQDFTVQAMLENKRDFFQNKAAKNAATITNNPRTEQHDFQVGAAPIIYDKVTQKFAEEVMKPVHLTQNATTITRYPLRSIGAGKNVSNQQIETTENQELCRYRDNYNNIHRCYRQDVDYAGNF